MNKQTLYGLIALVVVIVVVMFLVGGNRGGGDKSLKVETKSSN